MFFAREWILLGLLLIIYSLYSFVIIRQTNSLRPAGAKIREVLGTYQILVFLALSALSLAGLLNPIRKVEGWLEAYKWLVFLLAFLWGRSLTVSSEAGANLLNKILAGTLLCALVTWLPGSENIWLPAGSPEAGRFAFSFGYPNAAAALFGALILLLLKDKKINLFYLLFFALCLLATGSRAAVALLILCLLPVCGKRLALKSQENRLKDDREDKAESEKTEENEIADEALLFYKQAVWQGFSAGKIFLGRVFLGLLLIVLGHNVLLRFPDALQHLGNWTDTTLPERLVYYLDSFKLAMYAHFLPQAGGWFGFPFVQTIPYWTLDPHSSFCRILLNQGLAGVIILGCWALKGLRDYIQDLGKGLDLSRICAKTAALYLGMHSLIDVDLAFGALGIFFWLLVGLNSK